MRNIREKIIMFMQGRYGTDSFNNFLLCVYIALFLVNLFINSLFLSFLGTLLVIYMFYRMLSTNIYKRQMENQKFLKISKKPKDFLLLLRNRFRDRKTHVYKTCPACKSTLRLPRQKGKHTAVCPRCQRRFDVTI